MKEPNKTQFTFVENKKNKGLVDKIDLIAESKDRNRNDYLNIILSQHVRDHYENGDDSFDKELDRRLEEFSKKKQSNLDKLLDKD